MDWLDPGDREPGARAVVGAWLAVQRAFALAPQKLPEAFRACADPRALVDACDVPALSRAEVEAESEALAALGVRLVPIASRLYPARLRRLADAPPLLAMRGNAGLLVARGVAIVGSRAATAYGRAVARELGGGLARAGLVVISGLARGVDATAHEAALDAGGATLALLACGPEQVYPTAHRALAQRITASGALVTEFPTGTPPRAPYFPLRNRLISALAECVIVVEARERSGSLTTARHAAEQGVDVLAVPGPIFAPTSAGPNRLLREGAGAVTGVEDVLSALGLDAAPGAVRRGAEAPASPLAARVLRLLADGARTRDELARELAASPSALAEALLSLELDGRVKSDRDGRLVRGR
jgi:DNA processing protein